MRASPQKSIPRLRKDPVPSLLLSRSHARCKSCWKFPGKFLGSQETNCTKDIFSSRRLFSARPVRSLAPKIVAVYLEATDRNSISFPDHSTTRRPHSASAFAACLFASYHTAFSSRPFFFFLFFLRPRLGAVCLVRVIAISAASERNDALPHSCKLPRNVGQNLAGRGSPISLACLGKKELGSYDSTVIFHIMIRIEKMVSFEINQGSILQILLILKHDKKL